MHRILLIDFEASRLGAAGYPIEVAWADPRQAQGAVSLIRPMPQWCAHASSWDPAAAAVHAIARSELDGARVHSVVARALLKAAQGRMVVSDMPCVDQPLLNRLVDGPAPRIHDFWTLVRKHGEPAREGPAVQRLDSLLPRRHRADADVCRLVYLWRAIVP